MGYWEGPVSTGIRDLNSVRQVGLPWRLSGKESACQCGRCGFNPWVRKSPQRRECLPTPVLLPEKSPSTGETGRLQFMRSRRIVYDSATKQQHEVVMLLSLPFYQRKNSEAEVTKLVQGCQQVTKPAFRHTQPGSRTSVPHSMCAEDVRHTLIGNGKSQRVFKQGTM